MKSAYELAMERLEKQHGKAAVLTDAQKKALADIDQRAKAKQAEVEIIYQDKIAAARMAGNVKDMLRFEDESKAEINRIRDRTETEKESVRRDASLA